MKRFSVWMVFTMLCTFSILAQNKVITVSGRVIEDDSKEPAPQATIQLMALPDTTYAAGIASNNQGLFTLPKVKAGRYILKISYIGFKTKIIPLQLANNVPDKKVGTIGLAPDAVMLSEAVIVAEAPQVVVREDTMEYNSAAYRTPEGAMLQELVKKLPGAEIDDDGNIKINGKQVKKIMVDGEDFFGGDVKTGLENLPVNIIDKIKAYDKKSDLARVTGIDDGNEETVLDLTVKPGMKKGWFGNADLAAGTEDRYASNFMLNRFVGKKQFSLIGGANNVNDVRYSGGGGGPRFRGGGNGLTATKMLGANFATKTDKLELGGSARYNFSDRDVASKNYSEKFYDAKGSTFSNSNSGSSSRNNNFNADFRLEWKPDTLTNIIVRPNISYGKSSGQSSSESGTFNGDPFNLVADPNNYLNLDWANKEPEDDPLRKIRVNIANNKSESESNNLSANASLQVNRRLNSKGRNITFRGEFGYGKNDSEQISQAFTYVKNEADVMEKNADLSKEQYSVTPAKNYNYTAQLTYSEPIAKATFLQFSYRFQYKYNISDKSAYNLKNMGWMFGEPIPEDYGEHLDSEQSKKAAYHYYNHDISTNLRFIREKYQLNLGFSVQPQHTQLDYKKAELDTVVKRNVLNFSPNIDLRIKFSKVTQLRLSYRGNPSLPGMESLLPTTDNSDPLNIRIGNPGLKPSFSHSMNADFRTYNAELQRGINANASFSIVQNSISSITRFNSSNGGIITTSENINGNWGGQAMFGFNTALKDKRFTINTYSRVGYENDVSYIYNKETTGTDKNTSTSLSLRENLNASFRNDWFEFSLNGAINYNIERNDLRPESNQRPYTYGYGASTNIYLPWNMTFNTNIMNNSRRGYTDASMNNNELIWNAQIAQNFLKGKAATISFEIYDILKQQTNIRRSLSSTMRSVTESNAINSYCMLHFAYRLNIFGGKAGRSDMREGGFDRPRGGRSGGFHGGGFGGGFGGGGRM